MVKKTYIIASAILPAMLWFGLISAFTQPYSQVYAAGVPELKITISADAERVNREKILSEFFKKNNSPLLKHVPTFVKVAAKYNLDYRLLPAISCTESSCGKNLIPESYNPFGWGIYGNTVTRFASYDEAIEKVGEGLSKNYIAKGLITPEQIEPVYTPPSHGHWRRAVRFFMNQMDDIDSKKF